MHSLSFQNIHLMLQELPYSHSMLKYGKPLDYSKKSLNKFTQKATIINNDDHIPNIKFTLLATQAGAVSES